MAQLYCTGPAHIFVTPVVNGVVGSQAYLGTCEKAPRIPIRPSWMPVFNDIGGRTIPFDMLYEGEEAFSFLDLNRYNEVTLAMCQARPNFGTRGLNVNGDIGTLAMTEGYRLIMYVYFPYVAKAAMVNGGMPAGYRFPFTILEGPDDLSGLGTQARVNNLIFHHLRYWDVVTGQFLCYDHNVGSIPLIN